MRYSIRNTPHTIKALRRFTTQIQGIKPQKQNGKNKTN